MASTPQPGTVRCGNCRETIPVQNRFCSTCGAVNQSAADNATEAIPIVSAETFGNVSADIAGDGKPETVPVWRQRRPLVMAASVAGGAIILGCAGIGITVFRDQQHREQQAAAMLLTGHTQLADEIRQAAAATTTADLRRIAAEGTTAMATWSAGAPPLTDRERSEASSLTAAFTAITRLSALTPDTLNQWPTIRASLTLAWGQVTAGPAQGTPTATVTLAAIDVVVENGVRRIAVWNQQNQRVHMKQVADLAALNTYHAKVNALINNYAAMRDDTMHQLDAIRAAGHYDTATARDMFSAALQARANIRDAIGSQAAPKGVAGAQNQLGSAISQGMTAMSQLVAALDANQATCAYTSCDLLDQPSWNDFQTTSAEVTSALNQAIDVWAAAVNTTRQTVKDRVMAGKPVV